MQTGLKARITLIVMLTLLWLATQGNIAWATDSPDLDWRSGPPTGPQNPPTSSFFEGVSEELKNFCNGGEPEVTQPVQQAQGITPEAAGPFRVSPSKPSLPTSSWFEELRR